MGNNVETVSLPLDNDVLISNIESNKNEVIKMWNEFNEEQRTDFINMYETVQKMINATTQYANVHAHVTSLQQVVWQSAIKLKEWGVIRLA